MSDFYVTLPSHSSKSEFRGNVSNSFKIRLPHPIRLEGSGWKVGLVSIALPDTKVPLLVGSRGDRTILFKSKWIRVEGSNHKTGLAHFDTVKVEQVVHDVDGIGFMKSMLTFFEQQRIYNDNGPKYGASYMKSSGKRTYVKFKWEGNELVTDNNEREVHGHHPRI